MAPRSNYQLDILVYDRYTFHGYKYILVVIDVYSRFAHCVAMTNRRMETIISATKKCFEAMGGPPPKNLNCDQEFNVAEFNKFLDGLEVQPYYSAPYEINKNAIVERFNRTLALLLQRWRIGSGSYDWPKVLPELVDNYDNSYHSTIKATPADVFSGKAPSRQRKVFLIPNFKEGEQVRVKERKKVFGKGDSLTYSKDLYVVEKVEGNKVRVKSVNGGAISTHKPYELVRAGSIEFLEKPEKAEELKEHKKAKEASKAVKVHKKMGVTPANILSEKRQPKLKPELVVFLKK